MNNASFESSQQMKSFAIELMNFYWAEKAITKAIPEMIKNTTSQELIDVLTDHLIEIETQLSRMERIFESKDKN